MVILMSFGAFLIFDNFVPLFVWSQSKMDQNLVGCRYLVYTRYLGLFSVFNVILLSFGLTKTAGCRAKQTEISGI